MKQPSPGAVSQPLPQAREGEFWICPSILSADILKLGQEVADIVAAGADRIHIDVMDHHYVPNLTFGPVVCQALRRAFPNLPLDVHLMVQPVDALIQEFLEAGASCIVFHPEASQHVHRSLALIKSRGCEAGLALNPGTPLEILSALWEDLDRLLIMSVNPGFGGQEFIPSALTKIQNARQLIDARSLKIRLEVDGGVKLSNIQALSAAGADAFVIGSALFGQPDRMSTLAAFKAALAK